MGWQGDPKAVEAVEYLLSIGFNSDDFLWADAEEAGEVRRVKRECPDCMGYYDQNGT